MDLLARLEASETEGSPGDGLTHAPRASTSSSVKTTFWRWGRWLPLFFLGGAVVAVASAIAFLDGMGRVFAWYLGQLALLSVSGIVVLGTLMHALVRRRWRSRAFLATLPSALLCGLLSTLWASGALPVEYPASLAKTEPVARVRVPLEGPVRVAWGGDAIKTNYHAATPDQRWAYDLVVEPFFAGTPRLEDYGCYGRDVLAPAAGLVTWARDGLPEHSPGEVSNDYANPAGNSVAIRLEETGTYLLVAHLARGSVAVRPGDRVEEGQRLGACGNSGNTSEPHVHLHHQRQDPATHPIGFAEGLPLYFRDHEGPSMPEGGLSSGDVIRHVGELN